MKTVAISVVNALLEYITMTAKSGPANADFVTVGSGPGGPA